MADTLKNTYNERIDIVKDCLAHDRNIKTEDITGFIVLCVQ